MAHKNKVKGNTLEQNICKDLRDVFPFVKTARYANRMADDSKIDIIGIPFLIQAKSGYNYPRLRYETLFLENQELIKKNFPPNHVVHKLPYVLINKLNRIEGGKRSQPEMFQVTMSYDFFLELIKYWKTDLTEI
jgi:hypothetical protein